MVSLRASREAVRVLGPGLLALGRRAIRNRSEEARRGPRLARGKWSVSSRRRFAVLLSQLCLNSQFARFFASVISFGSFVFFLFVLVLFVPFFLIPIVVFDRLLPQTVEATSRARLVALRDRERVGDGGLQLLATQRRDHEHLLDRAPFPRNALEACGPKQRTGSVTRRRRRIPRVARLRGARHAPPGVGTETRRSKWGREARATDRTPG